MYTTIAEAYERLGNESYDLGEYCKAILLYSRAIDASALTSPLPSATSSRYYCNRSQAYLKVGKYTLAMNDAETAIHLDSTWWKVSASTYNSRFQRKYIVM